MKGKKILLIGGPSTGKTSLLTGLESKNYICYPEISREVTLKAQEEGISQLFLEKPLLFSELLLEGRIQQFKKAEAHNDLVFLDRGIPDVVAYMDFIGNSYPQKFINACKEYKYHHVFYFPPWEEIYVSDNERYETFEEALKIDYFLKKTYSDYGYQLIEIPKDSIEKRIKFIETNL